ncbi:MAG: ORF6N domain-containing protein [Sedimentisphaerales bacterium]|nr:ORF6N domain-containing protein [Sedimentisphaerales bacterium]
MSEETGLIIPAERIHRSILLIRRDKVILDKDLAEFYGVETRVLNQAVKRNIARFPADFMFQLTKEEKEQVVTNCDHLASLKFSSALPYAFTEQGVAMLSSVLRSKQAVEVNIAIMRTFVKLREILATNSALRRKIEAMERQYDEQFKLVFKILSEMVMPTAKSKSRIGYLTEAKGHRKDTAER